MRRMQIAGHFHDSIKKNKAVLYILLETMAMINLNVNHAGNVFIKLKKFRAKFNLIKPFWKVNANPNDLWYSARYTAVLD
jgi:hypothetical protein